VKEELIGTIPVPEGYIVKRSQRGDGEVLYEFLKDNKKASDFRDLVDRGQIRSQPSEFAEDSLITMTSELEHELQRKGLARAAYKDAENVTGRKIIPDKILTSKSADLHKKYGLGNEFGLSDYEPVFKEVLEELNIEFNIDESVFDKQLNEKVKSLSIDLKRLVEYVGFIYYEPEGKYKYITYNDDYYQDFDNNHPDDANMYFFMNMDGDSIYNDIDQRSKDSNGDGDIIGEELQNLIDNINKYQDFKSALVNYLSVSSIDMYKTFYDLGLLEKKINDPNQLSLKLEQKITKLLKRLK
jgi:hypothetical protein